MCMPPGLLFTPVPCGGPEADAGAVATLRRAAACVAHPKELVQRPCHDHDQAPEDDLPVWYAVDKPLQL